MSEHLDIFKASSEDFDQVVLDASHRRPILVDLWAAWCPPCLVVAPVLEKLVQESNGALALAKVEVDEGDNMKLAGHYRARGFPTVILFRDGEEQGRFSGAQSLGFVREFVERYGKI